MSLSTVLAKALYDNAAESPEELAFRKGDILMVLEQQQDGPGWWLCSLHGRQGIAPANRLRLLQTTPGNDGRRAPSVDSVYLSPGPLNHVNGQCLPDADSVYLSPPNLTDGVYQSPGAASGPGSRPRSHSSSGARPRPEWAEIVAEGRPRSPSLRGRGAEAGSVYQSPTAVPSLGAQYRSQSTSDSVYLTPSAVPRSAGEVVSEVAYLSPRESGTSGHSETCYLVPRPSVASLPGDDVYQSPVNTGPVHADGVQVKSGQEAPGMYQTPTQPGISITRTPQTERKQPNGSTMGSGQNLKSSLATRAGSPCGTSPGGRGKTSQAPVRGSPLLVRASKPGLPGSPNFARKPPPPAPPVRSVTRKDLPQQATAQATKPTMQANPASPLSTKEETQRLINKDGIMKKDTEIIKPGDEKELVVSDDGKHGDQVYDTPPINRWQHPVSAVSVDDESIYNTPRAVPLHTEQGLEIYDVPTHALNSTTDPQKQNYPGPHTVGEEAEEDVYSVPTLPGLSLDPCDMAGSVGDGVGNTEKYSVTSPGKSDQASEDASEGDGGIYDMPALTLDIPSCRLSVSSTSSGEFQWKSSVSGLVQAALSSTSGSGTSSRDLAASLAEILSVWKASHSGDVPPPFQQAWSRLADLLPALSVGGTSPPADSLLVMVRRALEDSSLLLQCQTRPRLPSQESLSRRPLPALPVAEVKPMAGGMGSRKGSWIQERPLPPPPPPVFPLPPASTSLPPNGQMSEDEELGNEYAGIGITPAPPSYPAGDSVGYVKLQGKPEPPPDSQIETGTSQVISTNDTRLSPSPPLPGSLSLEDSELLSFYSSQSLAHLSCLADAIDSLFGSVQENQPPRIFVARGKSLIVTAHKLVFIGDTLARLLSSTDLRAKVTTSSGRLCQALKTVVVATKDAAQNYPSVQATQEMVDRVAELSQHAAGFSALLQRLAEIS